MKTTSYRLDRFISKHSEFSLSDVRLLVAQRRIRVDGQAATSVQQKVTQFTQVQLDDHCLQNNQAIYLLLNKPRGYVSATKDSKHPTLLDLIEHPQKESLHIAGRLDLNTTGVVLLSNDGAWTRKISLPESHLAKTYEVRVAKPLNADYVKVFQQGIYFAYEDITTQPAQLEILTDFTAKLTLIEGKYHQVKRMFGYFQNEVLALHRSAVGHIGLGELKLGESRLLTPDEVIIPFHSS
ncbi:MAG: 16S rRNA pseudouridine(516) synthase [Oceanospirillales bacterium]|nr:MAG: 16S rRNA pseudouridine(516) synthase [Oceanospirillales bacterium]